MTTKKKPTQTTLKKQIAANLTNIKKIQKETAKLRKSLKPLIVSGLKDFMKQYPGIKEISWHQHTPYFADGDIPEFHCHVDDNICIIFNDAKVAEEFVEARYTGDISEEFEAYDFNKRGVTFHKALWKVLTGLDDPDLKEIWGDHVVVHCSSSKVWTTDDRDHD